VHSTKQAECGTHECRDGLRKVVLRLDAIEPKTKNMRVAVNQSRQDRSIAEIDQRGARGICTLSAGPTPLFFLTAIKMI